MQDIRIPVPQILLLFYLIGSAFIAYKTKRKSLWVLTFLTLISFIYSIIFLFIFPVPVFKGFIGIITTLLGGIAFPFIIFPILVTIETLLVRSKYLIILALISVSIAIIFWVMLTFSSM